MFGGEHRYIGLCVSKISEDLNLEFVNSVIGQAQKYGYKVLIFNAFTDFYFNGPFEEGEARVFDFIMYDKIDGLIVMSETINNSGIIEGITSKAREHGVFTVSIDKNIEGCCNISFNYKHAFEEIVSHVIESHGCRVINLVAGFKDNEFSEERINVCRRVMKAHGMELDDRRILYGDFWSDPTARAFDEFMETGLEMPDAFICCNDTMAITICSKLREKGFAVPQDVIVTGFDGIFEERYHIPRLTTAKQDTVTAGKTAVDAINRHLTGKKQNKMSYVIDHKVICSHSCGCKPIDYREATGQIIPLFRLSEDDNMYDGHMYEFSNAAADAESIEELAKVIMQYTTLYGYYYYALRLNEDFMNMSDDYESFIENYRKKNVKKNDKLILCEICFDKHYDPVYGAMPEHFEEAAERLNVFLLWSVHFREKFIGSGIMGLSTGLDGLQPNNDIRHLYRYSRNLSHVLEIANSQSVMKKVIARLQELYMHDHTGLYNRRGFYTRIKKDISTARKRKAPSYLVIISVDMDGLKTINDTYGHAEGDVAIKASADALLAVRGENEICARFGGDEFTVASICREDPQETGEDLVRRIKEKLTEFNSVSGKPYKVRGSFGIHWEKIDSELVIDNIIKAADDKMYRDKITHKEARSRCMPRD